MPSIIVRFGFFVVMTTTALSLPGCAADDTAADAESDESDVTSDGIVGGTIDKGHASVVLYQVNGGNCTGTLIARRVVLTAAHCVAPSASGAPATGRVLIGYDVRIAKTADFIPVTRSIAHPAYKGLGGSGHDAALLILSRAAPASVRTTAIQRTALGPGLVGKSLLAVGFGRTDGNGKGEKSGVKRRVRIPVSAVSPEEITAGNATMGTCNGDSGGPWLSVAGGREIVVGLTSYGRTDCRGAAQATRVDRVLDLIDQYVTSSTSPKKPTSAFFEGEEGAGADIEEFTADEIDG
jgi:secreted trypsin-like serine protease